MSIAELPNLSNE
jgi:hypothetical protein